MICQGLPEVPNRGLAGRGPFPGSNQKSLMAKPRPVTLAAPGQQVGETNCIKLFQPARPRCIPPNRLHHALPVSWSAFALLVRNPDEQYRCDT